MDEQVKKKALLMIPYGLYVVGAKRGNEIGAFTINWMSQASFKPPLVMLGVKKDSDGHAWLKEGQVCAVSILGEGQKDLAGFFFQKRDAAAGKFADKVAYELGATGCPVISDAPAFFECKVLDIVERGDHSVVVGEVIEAGVKRESKALTMESTGWQYGG